MNYSVSYAGYYFVQTEDLIFLNRIVDNFAEVSSCGKCNACKEEGYSEIVDRLYAKHSPNDNNSH